MLIDKHCHFHALCQAKLAYDSVQVSRLYAVELHITHFHIAHNAFAVQKHNALCQHTSHNLVLDIALLVKGLVDNVGEIHTFCHQVTCNAHGVRGCGRILEHACVVDHSRIDGSCNVQVDLLFVQKAVQYLTCGADLALYMIGICKARIADMMVNAHSLFGSVKILT